MLGHGTQRRRSRGVEEIAPKGPPLKVNERQPANTNTHRRGCIAPIIGIIAAGFGQAQADVIRMESFEMSSPSETYTDPMDPSTDHPLLNHPGQAVVVHDGWSAWYRNTRNGVGLTDGDLFGVGQIGTSTWADGEQGYRIIDTDGAVDLVFDPVSGATTIRLSLFIMESMWEEDDLIRVSWGNRTILDTSEMDIDDLDLEGRWLELTTTSDRFEALRITVDTNANDEGVLIDHIRWSQTVPSPGGLALLGLGLARSRRRP